MKSIDDGSGKLHTENQFTQLKDSPVAKWVRSPWRQALPVEIRAVRAVQIGDLETIREPPDLRVMA